MILVDGRYVGGLRWSATQRHIISSITIAYTWSRIAAGWCTNEPQLTSKIVGSFLVLVLLVGVGCHVCSKDATDSPEEVIKALVDIRDATTPAIILICMEMFRDMTKG